MLWFSLVLMGVSMLLLGSTEVGSSAGFPIPSYRLETTLLLAISTWVAVNKLRKISAPMMFTQVYLASIVLQLLMWVGYAGVIFYLDKPEAKTNAVYFIINFLIFISLEVIFLYRKHSY